MPICAGLALAAATGDGLVDRWRDLGSGPWLAAAGLVGTWIAALLATAALRDPRRVRPAPALLEPQGDEPPALVNLLTTDWDLGHEAVPGTLIDLAARRYLDIEMVGDDTFVRLRASGPARRDDLTTYEGMVLDHVSHLARETGDGRVPAQALTTGPEHSAKDWWRRFRGAVVADARGRGLSRPRWPDGLKAAFFFAAVPVALSVALAGSTLGHPEGGEGGIPAETGYIASFWAFAILAGVAGTRSGERDTRRGREVAARWLGLREQLAEDPLFADQPPAAVAIWDRVLAHGVALGVAHGVVQALPLGAESEREAWSPVGERWRVVRIRYPEHLPPGYGRHPLVASLYGLLHFAVGVPAMILLARGVAAVADSAATPRPEVDPRVFIALSAAAAAVAALIGLVVARGGWMFLAGLADLVTGRTTVEGRVLRLRDRFNNEGLTSRHLAVDDGTSGRVRAWRFRDHTLALRGDTVRGRVTRFLRHVADLEVIRAAVPDPWATPAAVVAAPAGSPGPAPPLPDRAAVSAAAGFALARDPRAAPHPLALPGGTALYRTGDAHVQVAWLPGHTMEAYGGAAGHHRLPGLGDEAHRARWGGGVIARRGPHVVMVTAHLPGLGDDVRDGVTVRIAALALAGSRPGDGGQHVTREAPQLPGAAGQVHQHVVDTGPA